MSKSPRVTNKKSDRSEYAGVAPTVVGSLFILISVAYWFYAISQPSTPLPTEGYLLPPGTRVLFDFLLASVIAFIGCLVGLITLIVGIVKLVKR